MNSTSTFKLEVESVKEPRKRRERDSPEVAPKRSLIERFGDRSQVSPNTLAEVRGKYSEKLTRIRAQSTSQSNSSKSDENKMLIPVVSEVSPADSTPVVNMEEDARSDDDENYFDSDGTGDKTDGKGDGDVGTGQRAGVEALLKAGNGQRMAENGVDEEGFMAANWKKSVKYARKEYEKIEAVKKRVESELQQRQGTYRVCFEPRRNTEGKQIGKDFAELGYLSCMREIVSKCETAIPKSRGGYIEVFVDSLEELNTLRTIATLGGQEIQRNEGDLFLTKIFGVDKSWSDEEIATELKNSRVVWVKRETFKRVVNNDECVIPTSRVMLKFSGPPPPKIKLLNQIHEVQIVSSALQCFKCLRYGHSAKACNSDLRCINCGGTDHRAKDCKSVVSKCANCRKSHKATDRTCFRRIVEDEKKRVVIEARLHQSVLKTNPDRHVVLKDLEGEKGKILRTIVDEHMPNTPLVILPRSAEQKCIEKKNAWFGQKKWEATAQSGRNGKASESKGQSVAKEEDSAEKTKGLLEGEEIREMAEMLCEALDMLSTLRPSLVPKLGKLKQLIQKSMKMLPRFLSFLNKLNDE